MDGLVHLGAIITNHSSGAYIGQSQRVGNWPGVWPLNSSEDNEFHGELRYLGN